MTDESSTVIPDQSDRQSEETLWEIEDVATYLRVKSTTTVRKHMAAGLPFFRLGGAGVRFVPAEVRAWARQQLAA